MDIETGLADDQAYSARGIVARINKIGDVQAGMVITPVFEFITLDTGKGNRPFCVRFVSPAPRVINEVTGEEYLDLAGLGQGDIVVSPGLLYKKVDWSDGLYAEHLLALKTYRPKEITVYDAPDADDEGVDLGALNMATDSTTRSAVHDEITKKTIH